MECAITRWREADVIVHLGEVTIATTIRTLGSCGVWSPLSADGLNIDGYMGIRGIGWGRRGGFGRNVSAARADIKSTIK